MAAVAEKELIQRGEQLKRDGIVIRTYDLWKTYVMGDQEIHAVSGVDIEIKRGEYVAIMGPSGSGKSTLMNLIGCLDTPTKGQYYINGNLVSEMTDDELARIRNKEIGFVFQTFNLLPRATSLHNVELPLIYSGMPADERLERAKHGHAQVDLEAAHVPQAQRALRRPAPARGGGPRAGQQPLDSAGRRAHRQPGYRHRQRNHGAVRALHQQGNTIILVTHEHDIALHHRIQDRRDLRRDQEQDSERLQPARDHRPHRRTALPLADREARAVAPLRSQDQEHGQRRAQRRRVLHPAPAHPRHGAGGQPKIGERIYDGACRLGGLPVRVVRLPEGQPQGTTTKDLDTLQTRTFYGKEKKSLAYVIAIMNMILHGIEAPNIIHTNTLTENLADIQEKDRYDVVLANPPFGGKERKEVQQNFPIRTGETAFLFLQHFIKMLKAGGRGGVVIKNTFLSNTDNASVSLRKLLLESCNLHTVLDCPGGTFQGAGVKTVVLFFEKGAPRARSGSTSSTPAATWARPTRSTTTTSPSS
jgi:ABC-type lipoprotein export system ATPase subunit